MLKELLQKPYWIIDILPEQVPAEGEGQFFAIEKYLLQQPQRSDLQKKFLGFLLKLNCYYDFEIYAEKYINKVFNPAPELLEEWMMEQDEELNIVLPSVPALIVTRPDDLYMTVYNPDEKLLKRISQLAFADGLFVRKPNYCISADGTYIGADGCKGGWIAAVFKDGILNIEKYETVLHIVQKHPVFDEFLIDMAIGLPESKKDLRPDDEARKLLRPRSSTIFSVPARQAVYMQTEEAKKEMNKKVLGKSLSKQTINIIPKIRELDEFMKRNPEYHNVICESHPELCFARMKGEVLLTKKNGIVGFSKRCGVLSKYLDSELLDGMWDKAKELQCNPDDILDAICLAVAASMKAKDLCESIPERPQEDARGLKMQMIVPKEQI